MFEFSTGQTVYIACGVTDLRKSFSGLAAIVKLKFKLDPYSKCIFAFCNRNRSLIKLLQWDGSGLWLHTKRLDRGSFKWPNHPDEVKQVSVRELGWLTQGLTVNQNSAFSEHHPTIII